MYTLNGVSRDHPRVCGEKDFASAVMPSIPGSPPRVRGKVSMTSVLQMPGGITPACAGKRLKKALKNKDF